MGSTETGRAEGVAAVEGDGGAEEGGGQAERALEDAEERRGEHGWRRDGRRVGGMGRGLVGGDGGRCRRAGLMGQGSWRGRGKGEGAICDSGCGRWSTARAMGCVCAGAGAVLCTMRARACRLMLLLPPIASLPPSVVGRRTAVGASRDPGRAGGDRLSVCAWVVHRRDGRDMDAGAAQETERREAARGGGRGRQRQTEADTDEERKQQQRPASPSWPSS